MVNIGDQGGMCADFEIRAIECIEYFGAKQGITACKDWYDDYMECQSGERRLKRMKTVITLIFRCQAAVEDQSNVQKETY